MFVGVEHPHITVGLAGHVVNPHNRIASGTVVILHTLILSYFA